MEHLKQQTATLVSDNYVDGFNLYLTKINDRVYWFKVPNSVTLPNEVKCSEIMEYYDETNGVKLDLKPLTPQ